MGSIVTNARIDGYVNRLFKERCVVLENKDDHERGVVASMVQRLRELRKSGFLTVAHDKELKRTVFVLQDGVKINRRVKYNFGGSLLQYVLTGKS